MSKWTNHLKEKSSNGDIRDEIGSKNLNYL